MNKTLSLLALLGFASLSLADGHAKEGLDYGDYASATLQVKGWEALGAGEYANAVAYTVKCAELHEEKAREMQASLDAKPSAKEVNTYWALNDVGTCYFIRGEALIKLKKNAAAMAAFKVLSDDLYYAQAWDPKGWYWSPAEAAYPKIRLLEARSTNDF